MVGDQTQDCCMQLSILSSELQVWPNGMYFNCMSSSSMSNMKLMVSEVMIVITTPEENGVRKEK